MNWPTRLGAALSLGLFFLFFFPVTARADFKLLDALQEFGEKRFVKPQPTRLQKGPLRLHPFLRTRAEYDDNILLEDADPREDVIFHVKPGAILEIPVSKHQFSFGYEADFENFFKAVRQNDQNQNSFALADLHFPSWYVNVLEKFSETSSRSGTTFTSRIPRYDQSIHPKIGYRWKRMIFEGGFRHFLRDFRRKVDGPFDFQLLEWTGVFYLDLLARLKALFEYQFAQIDYQHNALRNGTFYQGRIGLDGEVLPNLMLRVRAGPHFRNYGASAKEDFHSWVYSASADYQFRKNLKFKLSFSREPVEATFGNVNFYKEHALKAGLEYEFRPRWRVFSESQYIHHRYAERATVGNQTAKRSDHHIGAEAGIRFFPVEWLELETAYQFLYRSSNLAEFDYADNRFSITSTLSY